MKSCIIAGEGKLPILLAEKNKDFLVIVIRSLSASSNFKNETYMVDMLDFNEMIKIFKIHDIKKIIFAGKFYRQKNYRKKISKEVKEIIDETKFLGDDSTLKKIKIFFENNGFEVVSNECKWMVIHQQATLGVIKRSLQEGLMIKSLGSKEWRPKQLDFLGPIF